MSLHWFQKSVGEMTLHWCQKKCERVQCVVRSDRDTDNVMTHSHKQPRNHQFRCQNTPKMNGVVHAMRDDCNHFCELWLKLHVERQQQFEMRWRAILVFTRRMRMRSKAADSAELTNVGEPIMTKTTQVGKHATTKAMQVGKHTTMTRSK